MAGLNNIDAFVSVPDVDGWLSTLNEYASSAISRAENVASSLNNLRPDIYNPLIPFEQIDSSVSLGNVTKPVLPSVSLATRSTPASISLTTPTVASRVAPTFSTQEPTINLPSVPDPISIHLPVKDFTINTDLAFPVSPDTVLPEVPTLIDLDLPSPEALNLPEFSIDFPTSNAITVPGLTFTFTESIYSSTLLDSVKSELLKRMSSGTGLNPIVEQAIYDRGKDRESRAAILSERSILVNRAAQGFSRPTGSMMAALETAIQETQGKIIDLSRDIMIKQAELEQKNLETNIQQSIQLEDIFIKQNLAVNERAFEVAKYFQDIAIELYKVEISRFSSEVEAYKAFSAAYQARVSAELSKIEIFKAQIDAEKLKGDINEQNIRIYLARIEGIKSNVEVYKALISAVSEKLNAENLKLNVYKTDIDAYASGVKAKADEYSIYSEQIKGELAKIEVFDSSVKAYASRIQAYASETDVDVKKAEIASQIEGLKIKKYEADIEAYIKQVQADQLIYQSAVDLYKGQSQLYLADVSVANTAANVVLKQADNVIAQNKYKAEIALSNSQITLESIKAAYGSLLESKKAAGSIYAQIGASALSAINVSASLGGSVSLQASESHNYTDQ